MYLKSCLRHQHMYYHSLLKGINMVAIMSYAYIFLNVTRCRLKLTYP